jgi:nicotinamide mononucleotide adenylyltransferase
MLSETMAHHEGVFSGASSETIQTAPGYTFPTQKLKRVLNDSSRTPLVLVACGSFSPITFLHLRMFVMVADYANRNTDFEVVGSYLSPVSDAYKKDGLASATHRLKMCSIAVKDSPFVMVDSFEADRTEYTRTALVLDHFDRELNENLGGVQTKEGEHKNIRIVLLAGADLVGTFSTPGVWSDQDLDHILGRYGAMIIERHGTDIDQALKALGPWRHNIWLISQVSGLTRSKVY